MTTSNPNPEAAATATTTNATILRDCFSAELLKRLTSTSSSSSKIAHSKSKSKRPKRHPPRKQPLSESNSECKSKSSPQLESPPLPNSSDSNSTLDSPSSPSPSSLADDLSDFIDYLSTELFTSLPPPLQALSYPLPASLNIPSPDSLLPRIPVAVTDTLTTYALLPASTSVPNLLVATLAAYFSAASAAPPVWSATRADAEACEICGRDWIPLTYHHLIPRSVHDKVRKRGWHAEHLLGSVAWLCRACHSFVHALEGNEVLAREYFTVERLLEREEVRRWSMWVGRVRWKAR